MNRLGLVVLFAALLLPATVAAQTAAPVKIGWINVEQAIMTCDEGAKMVAELEQYVNTKQAELQKMRSDADEARNKLEVQGSKLTDEARMELEDKLESLETKMQRFQQDSQREFESRQNRIGAYISKRMGPVIEKVAQAKGLDAILIYNRARDLWINPALFVTEDIVKAYNQTYPASAAAPKK